MSLAFYLDKFKSIRPDRSSGRAKPHKVCMMFAVMDLVESGHIKQNRIYYDAELKNRFTWHFNRLKAGNDINSPFLPFNHLSNKTSGFWHLKLKPGKETEFATKSLSESSILHCIDYAYLDSELFEILASSVTRALLRSALGSNIDSLEEQYVRWAKKIGKSDKTVKNYLGALKSSISNWAIGSGITNQNILTIGSFYEYDKVASKIYKIQEFRQKDTRGKGMYSAALKSYRAFLSDVTQAEVQQDIDNIILDPNIPDTQKATLVNTRIGQGQFRRDLIDYWRGCAVTNYRNYDFLIASHIKPWAASDNTQRLDPYNGLLLLANLDKAFDRGYVSFSDQGKILISEALEDFKTLGISKDMTVALSIHHQDYLAYHREECFTN